MNPTCAYLILIPGEPKGNEGVSSQMSAEKEAGALANLIE